HAKRRTRDPRGDVPRPGQGDRRTAGGSRNARHAQGRGAGLRRVRGAGRPRQPAVLLPPRPRRGRRRMTAATMTASARYAADRATGDRWVFGGVAAELARHLRASTAFVRSLLFVALFFDPGALLLGYGVACVVIPHGDRRAPGWSNAVALGRYGLLWV